MMREMGGSMAALLEGERWEYREEDGWVVWPREADIPILHVGDDAELGALIAAVPLMVAALRLTLMKAGEPEATQAAARALRAARMAL